MTVTIPSKLIVWLIKKYCWNWVDRGRRWGNSSLPPFNLRVENVDPFPLNKTYNSSEWKVLFKFDSNMNLFNDKNYNILLEDETWMISDDLCWKGPFCCYLTIWDLRWHVLRSIVLSFWQSVMRPWYRFRHVRTHSIRTASERTSSSLQLCW